MVNNNNNSSSNTNNNKQCHICGNGAKANTTCVGGVCKQKSCRLCVNRWRVKQRDNQMGQTCAHCRAPNLNPIPRVRRDPFSASRLYARAAERQRSIAAARRARNRGAFQEPPPPALITRMYQRSGSTAPPPRVTIPNNRGRRSGAPSPEPRPMHTGGLVRKTGPHRLLKDEIVLSRAQRKGLTHGQIVKILKAYKKSK